MGGVFVSRQTLIKQIVYKKLNYIAKSYNYTDRKLQEA